MLRLKGIVLVAALVCGAASRMAWPVVPDTPCAYQEIYVVEEFGHVLKLNSSFETLHEVDLPGFMRMLQILTAEVSKDGKTLLLGSLSRGVLSVDTENWVIKEGVIPVFPVPQKRAYQFLQPHPESIISPRPPFFYVKDLNYAVYAEDADGKRDDAKCTFLLDVAEKKLCQLQGVELPYVDRIRVSPSGDKTLVINDPVLLIDSATGQVEKSLKTGEGYRVFPKLTGATWLRGVDIDWNTLKLDIWRMHNSESKGWIRLERVTGDMNSGRIEEATGPSPWPDRCLEPPHDPQIGHDIQGDGIIPSGILYNLNGVGCWQRLHPYPHILLRSWEARTLAQLKPEWFARLRDVKLAYTQFTPDAKHLILAQWLTEKAPDDNPKFGAIEHARLIIMDTHTGEIVKTIETPQLCSAILFR